MSYYDDASLVVIPSGYKTSKVYAEKPTDGSGDLAFTRTGDTATRVNSAGLIEKVRTNLILQSQTFDNASWSKTTAGGTVTVTANYGTAPDGTTTADRIQLSAPSAGTYADVLQVISLTSGRPTTYSVYLKALTGTPTIIFYNDGVTGSKTITLTSDWVRYTFTVQSSGIEAYPRFLCENGATSSSADILAWGAQLETSDIATAYIPTTTAAVSVGPVANVPRLDYLGSTCPRLLLEPQRTNLVTYSEQLDNAAWGKSSSGTGTAPVVTANNATSPDGYQNADTVVFDAGAGTTPSDQSILYQVFGGSTATYTCSFYAKTPSGTAQIQVRIDGSNYEKFTITNEWQRFTLTRALTGTSNGVDFIIRRGLNEPINASATIQLWGVQVELGAYATSYIPTLAASATRGADACSKTGISSLIGQTEGTIFAEFQYYDNIAVGSAQYISPLTISNGGYTDAVYFEIFNDSLSGIVFKNSALQAAITKSNLTSGTHRAALAYKQNDIAFYLDGVLVGTDSSADISSALSQINLGTVGGSTNLDQAYTQTQALLFKTRLTNAQLAELTTL